MLLRTILRVTLGVGIFIILNGHFAYSASSPRKSTAAYTSPRKTITVPASSHPTSTSGEVQYCNFLPRPETQCPDGYAWNCIEMLAPNVLPFMADVWVWQCRFVSPPTDSCRCGFILAANGTCVADPTIISRA